MVPEQTSVDKEAIQQRREQQQCLDRLNYTLRASTHLCADSVGVGAVVARRV